MKNWLHHTYTSEQAVVLLKQNNEMNFVDVKEKEKLIQTGQKHYSEMLSKENPLTEKQKEIFFNSLNEKGKMLAEGVVKLAYDIKKYQKEQEKHNIVLISLVRAGLPLAVLLQNVLSQINQFPVTHYAVSIIRDKGLDDHAINHIKSIHKAENTVFIFVDGWIGKGAITHTLKESCEKHGLPFNLFTLSSCVQLDGVHYVYDHDFIIPFGILGSVVSGLFSRSVYVENDFHEAVFYDELKEHDLTQYFVETILKEINQLDWQEIEKQEFPLNNHQEVDFIDNLIQNLMIEFDTHRNNIKPSISEATRAILRRNPHCVLVSDMHDKNLDLLLDLCKKQGVKVIERQDVFPYKAITIIQSKVGDV